MNCVKPRGRALARRLHHVSTTTLIATVEGADCQGGRLLKSWPATMLRPVLLLLLASTSALHLAGSPLRSPARSLTRTRGAVAEARGDEQQVGPWADAWAKYVLLRPGMPYSELKEATLRRNRLSPEERIPGTFRTVFIVHAVCFLAAIPILVTNEAIFPRLLQWAVTSRAAAGFGAIY